MHVGKIHFTNDILGAVNTSTLNTTTEYGRWEVFACCDRGFNMLHISSYSSFHSPQQGFSAACFVRESKSYLHKQRVYFQAHIVRNTRSIVTTVMAYQLIIRSGHILHILIDQCIVLHWRNCYDQLSHDWLYPLSSTWIEWDLKLQYLPFLPCLNTVRVNIGMKNLR